MIPISEPIIAKNAQKYLMECLKTGWVSGTGPYVKKFEEAFAHFISTKYAIACSSGTAAIHLSLVVSAKQNGIDPLAYMTDVLTRINSLKTSELDQLLPDHWAKTHAIHSKS